MLVYTCIENLKHYPPIFMALGTFDGVHIGHQQIILKTVARAKAAKALSAVFTFSNHPLSIIDPGRCPSLLITNNEKIQYLQSLGVDLIVNIPFTCELLNQTPEEFIQLLTGSFNLQHVVVGGNFTYGFRCGGRPDDLRVAGGKYNFSVDICQLVDIDGIHVSSTRIRQLIAGGRVGEAASLLNRPFTVSGKMLKSNLRNRKFRFLRAGVAIPNRLIIPAEGVYVVKAKHCGNSYRGVANIGNNLASVRQQSRVELLLDCLDDDLYYQDIKVEFVARLRGKGNIKASAMSWCFRYT